MLKKDVKKGLRIWHRNLGAAEFVGWFDHEGKDYAIVKLPSMNSRITLPRKEFAHTPRKIRGIKPGWYSSSVDGPSHFWIPKGTDGTYQTACGKAKVTGEALATEKQPRCKHCETSAMASIKTTLFDFEKKTEFFERLVQE